MFSMAKTNKRVVPVNRLDQRPFHRPREWELYYQNRKPDRLRKFRQKLKLSVAKS